MPRTAQLVLPTVDTCSWRQTHADSAACGGSATCGLIGRLLGPSSAHVTQEACVACCRSFPSSLQLFNPTVASLLYSAASALVAVGGNAECNRQRAAEIQQMAENSISIHHPTGLTLTPARCRTRCAWLGEPVGNECVSDAGVGDANRKESVGGTAPTYACHHAEHQRTTEAECRMCPDWSLRRPKSRLLTLDELIPPPSRRCGATIREWAVGVTTSPRRESTLETTLDSILRAGWPAPHLFVDGTLQLPPRYSHLPITWREEGLGAWPAWYFALAELVLKQPAAGAYMLLQDDVLLFDRQLLREYLERVLWPGERPGIVSLFYSGCSSKAGWFHAHKAWHFSAQGLIFAPGAARALLADADVLRSVLAAAGRAHIPVPEIVSQWAVHSGVDIWYANPSLLQHIGNTSTIWMNAHMRAGRRAAWFSGSVETEFGAEDDLADFPEESFVCPPALESAYRRQVAEGRQRMRRSRAVICGLVRNARNHLPRTAARIERLGEMFREYRILLVHQDSSDATGEFLSDWQKTRPGLEILKDSVPHQEFEQAEHRQQIVWLADCRNRYRTWIGQHAADFDYAIVVDTALAGGWSFDGMAHTFGQTEWDGVGSYGLSSTRGTGSQRKELIHFDIAAFRPAPGTSAVALENVDELELSRGQPWLPVESCFGGLAVYKIDCMLQATYGGADCEHVGFHRQLRQVGRGRLFLNPSQIVLTTPV